jgi:cytidine deaminase
MMRPPLVPGTPEAREALLAAATAAAAQAYATRSGVHVGAAVLSASGRIYAGCNVENAAFPLGNCAEPAAIAAGVLAEGPTFRIAEVAVWATTTAGEPFSISPCGGCRQRIFELATGSEVPVHFVWPDGAPRTVAIGVLLPHAFRMAPREAPREP